MNLRDCLARIEVDGYMKGTMSKSFSWPNRREFKNAVFSIHLNGYPYAPTKYLSGEPKLICAYTLLVCTIFAPSEI